MNLCPKCNNTLQDIEVIDTEWSYNKYFDIVRGHCPNCKKFFYWEDTYVLESSHPLYGKDIEDE